MYVSDLDRPWLDTPFLFQGFRITNEQEIEQIKSICNFVFVDTEKSTVPVSNPGNPINTQGAREKNKVTTRLIKPAAPYSESFDDEFQRATVVHQRVVTQVDSLFQDMRAGKSLNVESTRQSVKSVVDSILRHPDALLLLVSMGERNDALVVHAVTVCALSVAFGRYLGMEKHKLMDLGMGALLHDIGETKLPQGLVSKSAESSDEDREMLEKHTTIGPMLLEDLPGISESVIAIARDHHECVNGSGYPRKLTDAEIGVETKIVSIVDTYDSITSGIHGKNKLRVDEALKSMYSWRKALFDPLLVEKFIQCVGVYPLGSVVELRSGQKGIVISSRPDMRLFPRIMLVLASDDCPIEPPKMINLALFREQRDAEQFEVKRLLNGDDYGIDVRQYILREMVLA